jgi:hypothetical protein
VRPWTCNSSVRFESDRRPDFRNLGAHPGGDRHREHHDLEAPQARHRPPGAVASRCARRTQSRLQDTSKPTRSRFCLSADLEMEPDDRLAARQGSHGNCRNLRHACHAEGNATRLWRERVSIPRSTAPRTALDGPRLAKEYGDLRRRHGTGRARIRGKDVVPIKSMKPVSPPSTHL